MKKLKLFGLIIIMILSLLIAGCGGSDDGDDEDIEEIQESNNSISGNCECEESPTIDDNGIILIFEKQLVKYPSKIAVLMKAETEEGEPIIDLDEDNFKVYENGDLISKFESQQNVTPSPGDFKYNTLLVLDLSGSVLESKSLTDLKNAAKGFVEALMPKKGAANYGSMLMGIKWFDGSEELHSLVPFVEDREELLDEIDNISQNISNDPSTNLYGAVIKSIEILEDVVDTDKKNVAVGGLVIFTDGKDQAGRETLDDAVSSVEDADENISIHTIGLGGEIDETVLQDLGKDGFTFASDFEELVPKFQEIALEINNDSNSHYLLEYCSPKRKGQHELVIEVINEGNSCSLTTCFCANGFEGGCEISQTQ